MIDYELLRSEIAGHPHKLLFATVSGAHLYGFPSPDSDYDLRGVHILPLCDAVGLLPKEETVEIEGWRGQIEMDIVTHDVLKFCRLLLKRNGYVLEQLYSPLIVQANDGHEELKQIARGCVTRYHSHHYLGFAETQWKLFEKEEAPRVKPLLYVFRVLLTGIHLMRTGEVEANLARLKDEYHASFVDELIERKISTAEQCRLTNSETTLYRSEYHRLREALAVASDQSTLPEEPTCRNELNDFLVRTRLAEIAGK